MQYSEYETGLKLLLRKAHELIDRSTRPQDKLHAMSLAADIYAKLMDLSTNGAILTRNLKMIEEMKKILPTEEEQRQDEDIIETEEDPPIESDEEDLAEE